MKPYGREKKIKGGNGNWKIDCHPRKGLVNWWENRCDLLSRSSINQLWKRVVKTELNDGLK